MFLVGHGPSLSLAAIIRHGFSVSLVRTEPAEETLLMNTPCRFNSGFSGVRLLPLRYHCMLRLTLDQKYRKLAGQTLLKSTLFLGPRRFSLPLPENTGGFL
jgi:hypothetical protein